MTMKRFLSVAAALIVALGVSSCEGWLDVENYQEPVSTLTKDVNFVAESVICKRFDNIYLNYRDYDNFSIELTSKDNNGEKEVMILDLLLPDGTASPEGEYQVGYAGKYIALSKFDLIDPATGFQYWGGSYYGVAKDGYIGDYYGFLTEGKVSVSTLEGQYYITVDAKSEAHNVYVYYHGPLDIVLPK